MQANVPSIVAPSEATGSEPRQPLEGVQRWRFVLAALLLTVGALYGLGRGLQEPSLGWRFIQASADSVQALPTRSGSPVLTGVTRLESAQPQAVASLQLLPLHVIESAGIHNSYSDHNRFFEAHLRIWGMLQAGPVWVTHDAGRTLVQPRPKGLDELGLRFWFPWVVALLSLSVGLALWVYRPKDFAARCFLFSSLGYAFGMLSTAAWGSRLLTQDPTWWSHLHIASHAATFMIGLGLCTLLWRLPTRLGGNGLPLGLLSICVLAVVADAFQWLPTIALTFRLPVVAIILLMAALFYLQWRAAAGDPVKRAQLKWVGLLLLAGLSTVFVAYAYGATGAVVNLPQNYGLASVALLFVGLVPLVSRVGLFRLEGWWIRAWLWFLGGILVVAMDLVFITFLSMQASTAILLASALTGWVYFPLRQALWRWMARDPGLRTQDVLPDIVALVAQAGVSDARLQSTWLGLWERVFQPEKIHALAHGLDAVGVRDQGRQLWLPAISALPALAITLPDRGQRLFRPDDARRAGEIVKLVQTGLGAQQAYQEGARQERLRIASDLHDDLGATLLSIAQHSGGGRPAELARHAMDELRLSVRGLAGTTSLLQDLLADWRAESVSRLAAAGIDPQWQAGEADPHTRVNAAVRTQVTRILREAISNVIRHSQATVCTIEVTEQNGVLHLQVMDNGIGVVAPTRTSGGMGLAGMERRARKLGGSFSIAPAAGGGTAVCMRLPLQPEASANISPT